MYFAKQNHSFKKCSGDRKGAFYAHSADIGLMEKSLKLFNVAQNNDITIFNQPANLEREAIFR